MQAITSNRHTAHIRNLTAALARLGFEHVAVLSDTVHLPNLEQVTNDMAKRLAETQTPQSIKEAFAVMGVRDLIIPVELAAWLDGDIDLIVDEDDTDLVG